MDIQSILKTLFWILIVSGTVYYFTKSIRKLLVVAGGFTAFESWNAFLDLGVWPIVQGLFGIFGALGMIILTSIGNFIILKLYQKSKEDWLGITIIDDVVKKGLEVRRVYKTNSGSKKLLYVMPAFGFWVVEKIISVRLIPFIILSIYDSFVATAYYLQRENGTVKVVLKKKDYLVFILSTILSCEVWALAIEWLTLPAFKNVWGIFTKIFS